MIALHIGDTLLDPIESGTIAWNESGDDQIVVTVPNTSRHERLFTQSTISDVTAVDSGRIIWRGDIGKVLRNNDTIQITAYGSLQNTKQLQDYTEFYSSRGTKSFYEQTPFNTRSTVSGEYDTDISIGLIPDIFNKKIDDNAAYVSFKKGAALPSSYGQVNVSTIPQQSVNTIGLFCVVVEYTLPVNMYFGIQVRDRNQVFISNTFIAGDGLNHKRTIVLPLVNARYIYTLSFFNVTGGTYTNTAEDGTWFTTISDVRMLSNNAYTISGVLASGTSVGSYKRFLPNSMTNINVGDTAYFTTTSGAAIQILATDSNSFYADVDVTKPINSTFFIPKLYGSTILSDIATDIGLTPVILDMPDIDLPDATYDGYGADKIIDTLRKEGHSSKDLKIYSIGDNLIVSAPTSVPTYYADVTAFSLEKTFANLISSVSAAYTTNFSVNKTIAPITNTIAQSQGSLHTIRIKSDATISGAAIIDAQQYLSANSRIGIKSDFKVSQLYNSAGGIVEYPQTNARVIIRNILPELYGIGDYTYYLKSMVFDLKTGEKQYVIGEYLDSVSTLIAN